VTIPIDEGSFKLHPTKISLYYDRFKYRARIHIPDIHLYRNHYRYERISFTASTIVYPQSIKSFLDWKKTVESRTDLAIRVSSNLIDIYAESVDVIRDSINQIICNSTQRYELQRVEQLPNFDRSKIYLKNPKFKYRLYFKWSKLEDIEIEQLRQFIESYEIKCSDSLNRWFFRHGQGSRFSSYLWDNYFFDFDDDKIITLMILKFGNIVRRVCDIEKR
jgi:hypothetical protein